jgi:hypothetical protein
VDNLDDQIEILQRLDQQRQAAQGLREQALSAVTSREYNPLPPAGSKISQDPRSEWRNPGDYVEQALMLRAVAKMPLKKPSEITAHFQKKTHESLVKNLATIDLSDCTMAAAEVANPDPNTDRPLDHVPIFRSALVLRALAETPGYGLSPAALFCLYRIVQETNEVVPPTWMLGSARAGSRARATAFITLECVHALLALRRALIDSGKAARLIGEAAGRARKLKGWNDPSAIFDLRRWREREEDFRSQALEVSLAALRPYVIIELEARNGTRPEEVLNQFRQKVATQIAQIDKVSELRNAAALRDYDLRLSSWSVDPISLSSRQIASDEAYPVVPGSSTFSV